MRLEEAEKDFRKTLLDMTGNDVRGPGRLDIKKDNRPSVKVLLEEYIKSEAALGRFGELCWILEGGQE